jgi:hypothetical protein
MGIYYYFVTFAQLIEYNGLFGDVRSTIFLIWFLRWLGVNKYNALIEKALFGMPLRGLHYSAVPA